MVDEAKKEVGGMLDRNALLKRDPFKIEKVELSGGSFIYVREMSGRERDRFEQSLMSEVRGAKGSVEFQRNMNDFRAKLAVCTICDAGGALLLTSADIPTLSQNKSAAVLEKILDVSQKLNKITEEDKEALVKNSEGAQVDNSISPSVEN